jgi:hypothetical protein
MPLRGENDWRGRVCHRIRFKHAVNLGAEHVMFNRNEPISQLRIRRKRLFFEN